MKAPVSWLDEYFERPIDANLAADRLTLSGIEVDRVQGVAALDPLVLVGEITAVSALSQPSTVRVELLADRPRTLVSNATGLAAGRRVALALPGATLFSSAHDELVEVRQSELYGVVSEGMLASVAALGLGDGERDAVFLDASVAPGTPVSEALAKGAPRFTQNDGDVVLHLAILPNIARCQAMRGVAREVSALLSEPLKPLRDAPEFQAKSAHAPSITAQDAASVLLVTSLENVRVGPSPRWLKRRLLLAGMTPINNVVDASNYVMLELGQPTHPYDADLLPSLDLGVRRARSGDRLLTLQQSEADEPLPVPEGVPLIVSNDVPVAMAGVIGGRSTSISEKTRRVLLEAAAFDYVAIRRSQQVAKVYTEASARFSRGVNPELPLLATRRFIEVLRETSPELKVAGFGESSLGVPAPREIELTLRELNGSLGAAFTLAEAAACLVRAGLAVAPNESAQSLGVTVGNARADITAACDLVEEIARLAGYDRVPETMPNEPIPERLHEDALARREALRDVLVREGLQEIISYSLNGPELEARLFAGHANAAHPPAVAVLNPVSVERSLLRTSLLPALLETTATNLKNATLCRLFEVGPVFSPRSSARDLPDERERVAVAIAGTSEAASLFTAKPRALDFFDLKALVTDVLATQGLATGLEFEPIDRAPYRAGAAARISRGGREYGTLGAVHPRVLAAFDIEAPVFVADLELAALLSDAPLRPAFREYDRFPSIELDIALFIRRDASAAEVRRVARAVAGPLLRDAEVFDQFFNADLPAQKSLAIRLRLNAGARTLEMAEALAVRERVARALEAELEAKIRE